MRKSIIFIVGLVSLWLLPTFASATFKASVAQVRAGCSSAGGTFSIHSDGKGYGCTKANCDGKGGICTVGCDNNNNCEGQTPSRVRAGMGIFQGPTKGVATTSAVPGNILDTRPASGSVRPAATGAPASVGGAKPGAAAPQIR